MPTEANAHCKGKHSGDHPHCVSEPPPPPPACEDTFPGFVYTTIGKGRHPAETRLASSNACRTELLGVGDFGRLSSIHMTADRSKGVIVWVEDPGAANQKIVRRLDFTVDVSGILHPGQPVTILPLAGDGAQPGDYLYYEVGDVWGDATHDSLYITVLRQDDFSPGTDTATGNRTGSIYDLNTLSNVNDSPAVHTIFDNFYADDGTPELSGWLDAGDPATLPDCYAVPYPQFVPTCYYVQNMRFNPSGTYLYLENGLGQEYGKEGELWHTLKRIKTDDMAAGLPLAEWDLSGPELIFTADHAYGIPGNPSDLKPRPGTDPYERPDPEIVGSGENFLDADTCAFDYAPLALGDSMAQSSMWVGCIVPGLIGHTGFGNGMVWESADTYLFDRNTNAGRSDIYRIYVTDGMAGTEELLIENGRGMDTGL